MENLIETSKGLHTDYNPISQPKGTYSYLLNGVRMTSGAIENEKGTVLVTDIGLKKIIGGCVLDEDLILFMYPSEIGVLDKEDVYHKITDRTELALVDNQTFGVEAKKNYKGERIVFFVDGVNKNRRLNLDDGTITSPTFVDDINIQLTPDLPEVSSFSVIDGGSLPTGVYQATARLLTKSTNAAPFGHISPIISIIDEDSSASFTNQDGALPQTLSPKAIVFTISNIDPSYEYVELAIITYIGIGNVSQSYLLPKVQIQGRTSLNITYSSIDQQEKSVDLSNIVVKPITYDTAKTIVQKDNVLVLSNLTASSDTFNFQAALNTVKLKYFIEEVLWQPGYKDPLLSALKRGYRRGEVYSFGSTPNFKSSYSTTAYHIAAPANGSITANTLTKELGTYTSSEDYPTGKQYPTQVSTKVRHFRMPTYEQEPIMVNRNGAIYIRILGIEADFTDVLPLIPADTLKNLKGFDLVRQVRTDANKSILTQGIAQIHTDRGQNGSHPTITPGSGANNVSQGIGVYSPGTAFYPKDIAFYSPESVIYEKLFTTAQSIVPLTKLTGTQTLVADRRTRGSDNDIKYGHLFLDYSNQSPFTTSLSAKSIVPTTVQYVRAGADNEQILDQVVNLVGVNKTVGIWGNTGYLYFSTTDNLPINEEVFNGMPEFRYDDITDRTDKIYLNGNETGTSANITSSSSTRYLYNLVRNLVNQYGTVSGATYIYCDTYRIGDPLTKRFFGGDTFIGKFGVVSSTGLFTSGIIGYDKLLFKSLNYFFVESEINVDLRHYSSPIGTEGQSGFIAGTTPYYPKYQSVWNSDNNGAPGLLNLSWSLGHGRGYNRQYSFENSLVKYNPKLLEEDTVTGFQNRSIYSEQSVEGEQLDAYRVFLPNNYHDIPKDKGPIVNSIVYRNTIYLQTTGATYRTFFNEKVTQASSIGEVYIGTGGLFDRPSEPIQSVNGGYGGTQGKWGVATPYGYFYLDARQKIVFNLQDGLSDLTGQGLDLFFNTIQETDQFHITFDYDRYRLLLTSSQGWTLSYQILLKSWTGYHSYNPYWMINRGDRVYCGFGSGLHKMYAGPYGKFFGTEYPLIFEYVMNEDASITKSFNNLVIHSSSYSIDPITQAKSFKPYDTFSKMRVYNDVKDTSPITLVIPKNFDEEWVTLGLQETFAKYKNLEYRLTITKDLLENPIVPQVYVASKEFRPQMTGKWAKVRLTYNTPNTNFVLHTIETKIGGVPR